MRPQGEIVLDVIGVCEHDDIDENNRRPVSISEGKIAEIDCACIADLVPGSTQYVFIIEAGETLADVDRDW